MQKIRIFFLRLLVGWWFIPIITFFGCPIIFLLSGSTEETKDFLKTSVKIVWFGSTSGEEHE